MRGGKSETRGGVTCTLLRTMHNKLTLLCHRAKIKLLEPELFTLSFLYCTIGDHLFGRAGPVVG